MRKALLALAAVLLAGGTAYAGNADMAGTYINVYLGAGGISPSNGNSDTGAAFGLRIEQFRGIVGGGMEAKGIYTGKGDGHSGGYGTLELYRRVAGNSHNGVYFGLDFGYLGFEWQKRDYTYGGTKETADWGGVQGVFAAPAVRINLLDGNLFLKASYYAWGNGKQKLSYEFLGEKTYITPHADFHGFMLDAGFTKDWKPGYFFGLNASYVHVNFDSASTTDPYGKTIELDSVSVNGWTVGVTAGLRW
jgi:hypothetical protein